MVSVTDKVTLDYEYRSLTDVVYPDAVPSYLRQLESANELIGYSIDSY